MLHKFRWRAVPVWVLVAFFIAGGIGNIFVSAENAANYARWGYPDWFHYVTGMLELSTAALLAPRRTRLFGAGLGSLVMLAAAGTVLLHGEYTHAIAPFTVLAVLALAGWFARRDETFPADSSLIGAGDHRSGEALKETEV